jgi:hypothetical protein
MCTYVRCRITEDQTPATARDHLGGDCLAAGVVKHCGIARGNKPDYVTRDETVVQISMAGVDIDIMCAVPEIAPTHRPRTPHFKILSFWVMPRIC